MRMQYNKSRLKNRLKKNAKPKTKWLVIYKTFYYWIGSKNKAVYFSSSFFMLSKILNFIQI